MYSRRQRLHISPSAAAAAAADLLDYFCVKKCFRRCAAAAADVRDIGNRSAS